MKSRKRLSKVTYCHPTAKCMRTTMDGLCSNQRRKSNCGSQSHSWCSWPDCQLTCFALMTLWAGKFGGIVWCLRCLPHGRHRQGGFRLGLAVALPDHVIPGTVSLPHERQWFTVCPPSRKPREAQHPAEPSRAAPAACSEQGPSRV